MSLLLPPTGHALRAGLDVAHLADIASPEKRHLLPTSRSVMYRDMAQMDRDPLVMSIDTVVRDITIDGYERIALFRVQRETMGWSGTQLWEFSLSKLPS